MYCATGRREGATHPFAMLLVFVFVCLRRCACVGGDSGKERVRSGIRVRLVLGDSADSTCRARLRCVAWSRDDALEVRDLAAG
jgi:hypothetical protein